MGTERQSAPPKGELLNEIVFIRPILVILLVTYHSLAPFSGAWNQPVGITQISLYGILGKLAISFLLECFFFISGYIFTYQQKERRRFKTIKELGMNKFERLLIPCFLLGIVYFMCFRKYESFGLFFYSVLSGIGHLWYLPCLFWCFLIQFIIIQNKWNWKWVLTLLFLCAITISRIQIPFQLNIPLYYVFFFYLGGVFYHYKNRVTSKLYVIVTWCLFILLFFIKIGITNLWETQNIVATFPFVKGEVKILIKIIVALTGCVAIWQTAILFCRKHKNPSIMVLIGTCGYGVYLFHQFFLMFLYFHTSFSTITGTYLMPWLATVITMVLSVSLTYLLRLSALGHKYL